MVYGYTRKPRKKGVLGIILILLGVALAAGVIYFVRTRSTIDLSEHTTQLPGGSHTDVFPYDGGVLLVEDTKLTNCDLSGRQLWAVDLPAPGMRAAASSNKIVVWGEEMVLLVDREGGIIELTLDQPGEVVNASVGSAAFACVNREEGQHRMHIYTFKGAEMDAEPFPYQTVLGLGFYGPQESLLWTLLLDSHGTTPITRLMTFNPGKTTTNSLTLNQEMGYRAVVQQSYSYVVGTRALTQYDQTGTRVWEKILYGWSLQDVHVNAAGRAAFLFAPAAYTDENEHIAMLWYIGYDGVSEQRFSLPNGCTHALFKDADTIIAAARQGLYTMGTGGQNRRLYPTAIALDDVVAVVPGQAVVARSGSRNYIIPLP